MKFEASYPVTSYEIARTIVTIFSTVSAPVVPGVSLVVESRTEGTFVKVYGESYSALLRGLKVVKKAEDAEALRVLREVNADSLPCGPGEEDPRGDGSPGRRFVEEPSRPSPSYSLGVTPASLRRGRAAGNARD